METEIVEVKKSDRGFTLVELLIVIVILGILATVTVFAVRGITNQGQTSACAADEKTLQVAAEAYMAQEGEYPLNVQTMVDEGLLRDVSTNWTYSSAAFAGSAAVGTVGDPGYIPAQPAYAAQENFTLTPVAPCV